MRVLVAWVLGIVSVVASGRKKHGSAAGKAAVSMSDRQVRSAVGERNGQRR